MNRYYTSGCAIAWSLILFSSCDKEPTYEQKWAVEYRQVLDSLDLSCSAEAISEISFHAYVDGTEVCYYDGADGYRFSHSRVTTTVTSGPVLGPGAQPFSSHVEFQFSPGTVSYRVTVRVAFLRFPTDLAHSTAADSVFRTGPLPIWEKKDSDYSPSEMWGVRLSLIMLRCPRPEAIGCPAYRMSTGNGPQPEWSRFEFTEVKKKDLGISTEYEVELRIDCLLYHDVRWKESDVFGELRDGVLRARFQVPN